MRNESRRRCRQRRVPDEQILQLVDHLCAKPSCTQRTGEYAILQSMNRQPVNRQPVNRQLVNRQPVNRQPVNKQRANVQPVNRQPVNRQPMNR